MSNKFGWGRKPQEPEPSITAGYGSVPFMGLPREIEQNEPDTMVRLRAVAQALANLVIMSASDPSSEMFTRFATALKGLSPFTIGMGDHGTGKYVKLEITVLGGEEGVTQALTRPDGSINQYRSDTKSGPTQSKVERGMWTAIKGAMDLDSL